MKAVLVDLVTAGKNIVAEVHSLLTKHPVLTGVGLGVVLDKVLPHLSVVVAHL